MTVAGGGAIFVSYRRQDGGRIAGRLYDRLSDRFGEGRVFMDVSTIEPGVDFAEEITRAVAACQGVLVAVIGPDWLIAADERGRRRLDDPITSSGWRSRPLWPVAYGSFRSWRKAR